MKRILALVLILGGSLTAMAQSGPQIPLSGSIGVPGSVATLGWASVVFPTDANITLTANQWAVNFLKFTSSGSLTATRNVVAPLNTGQNFVVENLTTGGRSIQIIGASGTGVTIANGATVFVSCDGTNYTAAPTPSAFYQVVQSSAASVTQRTNLNFGTGFTLTDSSSPSTTTVNLTGTSGTVISFASGNLLTGAGIPFFTTSVTGPTSTVVQSFTMANAPTDQVFGNCTGIIELPSYCNIVTEMLPFTYTGDTNVLATASGGFIAGDGLTTDANANVIDSGSPATTGLFNAITCTSSIAISPINGSTNSVVLSCPVTTIAIPNGPASSSPCTTIQVSQNSTGGFSFTGWSGNTRGTMTISPVASSFNSQTMCWNPTASLWISGEGLTNE